MSMRVFLKRVARLLMLILNDSLPEFGDEPQCFVTLKKVIAV